MLRCVGERFTVHNVTEVHQTLTLYPRLSFLLKNGLRSCKNTWHRVKHCYSRDGWTPHPPIFYPSNIRCRETFLGRSPRRGNVPSKLLKFANPPFLRRTGPQNYFFCDFFWFCDQTFEWRARY